MNLNDKIFNEENNNHNFNWIFYLNNLIQNNNIIQLVNNFKIGKIKLYFNYLLIFNLNNK